MGKRSTSKIRTDANRLPFSAWVTIWRIRVDSGRQVEFIGGYGGGPRRGDS
jgi:hypothetical protein